MGRWLKLDESIDDVPGEAKTNAAAEGVTMYEGVGAATGFYISPIETITRGLRVYRGSRADGLRDDLTRINTMMPAASTLAYGITYVNAPPGVHDLLGSVVTVIYSPPMAASTTWAELPATRQAALTSNCEAQLRLPMEWVSASTPLGEIVRRAICLVMGTQRLGIDFPLQSLDALWSTVPTGQQTAILNYLIAGGIETGDILSSTPIRTVLTKMSQYPYGSLTLGADSF